MLPSELESFTGAVMRRRFHRTCQVCGRLDLKNISIHHLQVHGVSSEERRHYFKQVQVSAYDHVVKGVSKKDNRNFEFSQFERPGFLLLNTSIIVKFEKRLQKRIR